MAGGGDERGSSGGGKAISVAACSSRARAVATGEGGGRDGRDEDDALADAGAAGTSLTDRREGAELGVDLAGSLGREETSRDDTGDDEAREGAGSAYTSSSTSSSMTSEVESARTGFRSSWARIRLAAWALTGCFSSVAATSASGMLG